MILWEHNIWVIFKKSQVHLREAVLSKFTNVGHSDNCFQIAEKHVSWHRICYDRLETTVLNFFRQDISLLYQIRVYLLGTGQVGWPDILFYKEEVFFFINFFLHLMIIAMFSLWHMAQCQSANRVARRPTLYHCT